MYVLFFVWIKRVDEINNFKGNFLDVYAHRIDKRHFWVVRITCLYFVKRTSFDFIFIFLFYSAYWERTIYNKGTFICKEDGVVEMVFEDECFFESLLTFTCFITQNDILFHFDQDSVISWAYLWVRIENETLKDSQNLLISHFHLPFCIQF